MVFSTLCGEANFAAPKEILGGGTNQKSDVSEAPNIETSLCSFQFRAMGHICQLKSEFPCAKLIASCRWPEFAYIKEPRFFFAKGMHFCSPLNRLQNPFMTLQIGWCLTRCLS